MALSENQPAPSVPGVDYSSGWTLVYFYPADFTPGCTTEACSFRDNFSELSKKVKIVGVSPDSDQSHEKFKSEHQLPFDLISDPDKKISQDFGANGLLFTKRSSFLINPQGVVVKIYNNVNPQKHASQVIKDLSAIS